jgi:hypothetical protein
MNLRDLAIIVVALSAFAGCGGATQTAGPLVTPAAGAPPLVLDPRATPSMEVRIDAFSGTPSSKSRPVRRRSTS